MIVFITGASSGIGAQFARHYAARGATLGLVARRAGILDELVRSLPEGQHGPHQVFAIDITTPGSVASAARAFMDSVGIPEIVIANAGISAGTLTQEPGDLAVFEKILATNLTATVATFQPFVIPMQRLERARLVAIGSVAGIRGLPGASAYSASKAAVRTYAEGLRVELADTAVRVVTIAPGYIATPMTAYNPYRMPFLMPVDEFVEKAGRAIDRGDRYRIIPWQMGVVGRLLRWCPDALYDRLAQKAGRKPRSSEIS